MQPSLRLNRRAFLQAALTTAAAAGAGVACGRNGSPWRFFTLDEARTLASMVDQIIPPDQDAGAVWAGVVNYIDRQLCGPIRLCRTFIVRDSERLTRRANRSTGKFSPTLSPSSRSNCSIDWKMAKLLASPGSNSRQRSSSAMSWITPCRASTAIPGTAAIEKA
jgi:hypothetical protein